MNAADDDKEKASEADLRKAVEELNKKEATEDRGDMPVDSALGHPETENRSSEPSLPTDDEANRR